jgi:RimJ/RimL family protein N-acetyltransferase
LSEILELFELSDPEHQAVLADAPAYVATRAQLWVAQKEGETVTCGWELKGPDVSVGEIGARLELPERTAVLTDFRTFSRYRRRGYYGALLRGIRPTEGIEQHLIYALKRNAASIRAIEQSGFVPLGQMIRSVFGALRYCPSRPTPLVRLRYAKRIEPH